MSDEKTTKGKPSYSEIGSTGLHYSSGYVYEEFLPKLRWPRAGDIYLEMSSNDPVITAILLCARQLVRNVTWSVEDASDSPEDKAAGEFLRECMEDMSTPWTSTIDDILSFFEYGWSYNEIVYKHRTGKVGRGHNSKYSDGRIGWHKIVGRSQRTLESWKIDEKTGSILGMNQYTEKGTVFIPIEKALLFRTTTARNNPEGKSLLRGAYRPWYFKKHIEEVEGIGIERDLAGLPVVTAPEGVDVWSNDNPKAVETRADALKLVSSIRRDRNEGVLMPFGWTLELLSSGSSRQFDTSAVINRYDQRIAITMLADIVMLGADKVGSFALANVKQSMLGACLDALMSNVVDIFNTIAIPRLFALNTFNITKYPQMKISKVVAPDTDKIANYISKLSGAKMPLFPDVDLENYLRSLVNFPAVTENEELRERQERVAGVNDTSDKGTKAEEDSTVDDPKKDSSEQEPPIPPNDSGEEDGDA